MESSDHMTEEPMRLTAHQIETDALSLPRPERERSLEALVASLETDPDVGRAWDEEIRRRLRDINSGVTELISGDIVFKGDRGLAALMEFRFDPAALAEYVAAVERYKAERG
jgi:hypothetical protein